MQTTASDPLRATQAASHGQRKLTPLADNAFRLLGLSCRATQKEIYAAASGIRRAIKLGFDRTPAPQLLWLGAQSRTENSVRDALSRLADPSQRIYERFYWFFDPEPLPAEPGLPALEETSGRWRAAPQPSTAHDIALLSLAVVLQIDPKLNSADDWQRTYALWKELIEAKEFWSLLTAADLKGDFEQVATFGEVRNLRARAWRLVTAPVAELAKDGILLGDHQLTRRALAILRRSELPEALAAEYENEILAPVEDKFETLFSESFSLYCLFARTNQSLGERRDACLRALDKFDEHVQPALREIFELAGAQSVVARRMFEVAAEGLDELADSFERALEPALRLRTLRRAWQLAPPESATLLLIEERLHAAGDRRELKPKTDGDYAHQLRRALLRKPVAQPELFTNYIGRAERSKTFEGRVRLLAKVALVLLFAAFVGRCIYRLPGTRRAGARPPLNFNVAPPEFTPTPQLRRGNFVYHTPPSMLQVGLILKSVVALDVRAKNEYDAEHVEGAISIPAAEIAARAKRLPKSKRIVLYGTDEEESRRAALELLTLGFEDVSLLEGGYQAWLDAKLPVTRGKANTPRRGGRTVIGTRDPP